MSVDIRGAAWGVAPFSLNEGTNRVLPWANLDELIVTYAAPRATAPALTLFGPTDGGGTITPTLIDWDVATATATYTYSSLQTGYYRVGTANTNYDCGVLPCHSNGNGIVNFADFGVFGPSFGLNYLTGPPLPAPHIADYNGNGIINFADFGVFGPAFGSNLNAFTPPTGPAPPPPPPAASFAALAIDAAWASIFDVDDDEDEVDSLLVV